MNTPAPLEARTEDGWFLRGECVTEGAKEKPVALLLHAMMANRKSMDRPKGSGLGSTLAARGLGVVSFDLRGHGESGPSASDGARFTYDDFVLRDLPTVVSATRKEFPNRPVVVVGHSLGAHSALASSGVAPEKAPDAVVSIAGNMWIPSFEPDPLRRMKKTATLAGFLAMAEAQGFFDTRALRMGTDPVALPYVRQFWMMWRQDRYGSFDGSIDYRQGLRDVRIPVLSVVSEGDTLLAHPVAVEHFAREIGTSRKTLRVVTRQDVNGPLPDHMGLVTNSISRGIWGEIADWIQSICK